MLCPDGSEFPNRGGYLEVRLMFTDAFMACGSPKPFMTVIRFGDLATTCPCVVFSELNKKRPRFVMDTEVSRRV